MVAAFDGARAWLSGDAVGVDWEALVAQAAAAASEIDDGLRGREADVVSGCAMDVAHAASSAANTANALQPDFSIWASYAAKHALSCSEDYLSEVGWQVERLVALLLSAA